MPSGNPVISRHKNAELCPRKSEKYWISEKMLFWGEGGGILSNSFKWFPQKEWGRGQIITKFCVDRNSWLQDLSSLRSLTLQSVQTKPGLPDIPKLRKMYQKTTYLPNGHNMFKMGIRYTNIFHFKASRPSKIYPIWIFKINHLAALVQTPKWCILYNSLLFLLKFESYKGP
jgi:hypothetical protein